MPRLSPRPAEVLALCVALGTGCTNRLAPPPGSGGTDAAIACTIPLDQAGCEATYMAQVANSMAQVPPGTVCDPWGPTSQAGTCGPYLVSIFMSDIVISSICVYDAIQQTLVSATFCTRLGYCDGYCASAGSGIDPSSVCDVSSLPLVCTHTDGPIIIPDGGSTDAGDPDGPIPPSALGTQVAFAAVPYCRDMSIIQAIIALITRSAGRIVNAIFGWAVHALFGRTSPRDQTMLSVILGAAVAWPVLALGVALPKTATFVFARVPLSRSVPSWIVRTVWLVLAVAVPLVLGVAIAAKGRLAKKGDSLIRRLLMGFPLTLGLALAFLIMFLSVPIIRLAALARRETSTDVPLVTDKNAYHQVAGLVVERLNMRGFELEAAEPGWLVTAPTRILALFGGSAFRAFVPERLEHFEDRSLKVSFYPSGVLLRGQRQRMIWARALIEEAIVRSDGLQTSTTSAQDLERRIREVWRHADDQSARRGSPSLLTDVEELGRALASIDVDYDEWQALYRQTLELERAIRGQQPLLGNAVAAEQTRAR